MRKIMKELPWRVTCDTAFQTVMKRCAESKFRKDKEPSWITTEYIDIYTEFYTNGRGHSFEVWNSTGELIGEYMVSLPAKFFQVKVCFPKFPTPVNTHSFWRVSFWQRKELS
jgi:Leu/Phe-tRNA-protein transferase